MVERIYVERATGNGKYSDVLDACEVLARGEYASLPNALVVMARQSPLYRDAMERLKASRCNGKNKDN